MEQLNRKTIPIFTTNWYLYKTHMHQISSKVLKQHLVIEANSHWIERKTNNKIELAKDQKKPKFDELLIESIDEELSVIGKSIKKIVYAYLEKKLQMTRFDIPNRIEEFINAIESIFGNGAKILELKIMKCLFKKVDYELNYLDKKNITFIEYINAIRIVEEKKPPLMHNN
jgi:hypothetical protein